MDGLISYPYALIIIGIVLITLEAVVFGFATLFLIFIGLGCFTTALLMWIGILDSTFLAAVASVSIATLVYAVSLWKPLHRLQNKQQDPTRQTNTLDGLSFRLPEPLSITNPVSYRYSGVSWQVLLESGHTQELPAGAEVEVYRTEVGKLFVMPRKKENNNG
jgi:membrane protein implicated in regulation of membrane protease activity